MPIGDSGGLKLSVSIAANLTGFEAIAQLTKDLEVLQQMAVKTTQAFRNMSAAMRSSMNTGTGEMARTVQVMERVSRNVSPVRATESQFVSGVAPVSRDILDRAKVNQGLADQKFSEEVKARNESTRAIREETTTRQRAWEGFRSGVMASIGLSATFGAIEMAKHFIQAAAKMDDRRASLRLQGLNPNEVDKTTQMALRTNVPGLNLAEKSQLAQQIGTTVGQKNVTPESMETIAANARAISFISGGSLQENIEKIVQTSQSLGNLTDATGGLSAANLARNSTAVKNIVAATAGRVDINQANQMLGYARAGLQGLDVAGNVGIQADLALAAENRGITGKSLGEALRFTQGGHLGPNALAELQSVGMLNTRGGIKPEVNPLTGKTVLQMRDLIKTPASGNPLDFYREFIDREKQRNPNVDVTKLINNTFPPDVARVVSAMASDTGREEHQRNVEAIEKQPQGAEMLKAMESFNAGLLNVKAAFEEFAQVVGGPLMQDAAHLLNMIAGAIHGLSMALNAIAPVLPILTRIVEILAILAAARFVKGRMGGATAGAAAEGLAEGAILGRGLRGGAAGGLGAAEGLAAGAVAGRAASAARTGAVSQMLDPEYAVGGALAGAKAGAMRMVSRGITGLVVGMVVDSVADSFTSGETNSFIKDAVEGGQIGFAIASWPGMILGAILDPLVKRIPTEMVNKNMTEVMKKTPDMPYQSPWTDPTVGFGALPGSTFTNADALKAEGIDVTRGGFLDRERQAYAMKPQKDIDAAHHRSWDHSVTMGKSNIPIPLPGAPMPPGGVTPRDWFSLHHTPMPSAMPPAVPQSPLSPETTVKLQDMPNIGTQSINAGTLNVGNAPAVVAPPTPPTTAPTPPAGSQPVSPSEMFPAMPMVGGGFNPRDVHRIGGIDRGPSGNVDRGIVGAAAASTMPAFHGKGIHMAPVGAAPSTSAGSAAADILSGVPSLGGPSSLSAAPTGRTELPMPGGGNYARMDSFGGFGGPTSKEQHQRAWSHAARGGMGATPVSAGTGAPGVPLPGTLSAEQAQAMRGKFSLRDVQPNSATPHPNIDTVPIRLKDGSIFRVAPQFAGQFQGFVKDMDAAGIPISTKGGGGGYNNRMIAGTNIPSKHALGGAVDFNVPTNQRGTMGNMPPQASEIASQWGLTWGGKWGGAMRDPMHFEVSDITGGKANLASGMTMPSIPPNVQGPQVSPEQADVPANQMSVHIHSQNMLDGELISSHVAQHFIGGGPTASPSATAFDSKAHPLVPGASIARW